MGTSGSRPTVKDSQCGVNPFSANKCRAASGYDANTCQYYGMRCYSKHEPMQCSASDECGLSWTGECVNLKGGSSLYCRHQGAYGACECYVPSYNAMTWAASSSAFPERCRVPSLGLTYPAGSSVASRGVSLAYSGGGSRSFAAQIGYMRYFVGIGAENLPQYVSTVSGGSWFHGAYTFARGKGYTNAQLLGTGRIPSVRGMPGQQPPANPGGITLANLESDNSHPQYLGARMADADVIKHVLAALVIGSNVNLEDVWSYTVGKIVLDPYGLNNDVPVALDAQQRADIEARNKKLGSCILPELGSPFWLCNASLLYDPTTQKNIYAPYTYTPMYSGLPVLVAPNVGGMWIETFASNTRPPLTEGTPAVIPASVALGSNSSVVRSSSSGTSNSSCYSVLMSDLVAVSKVRLRDMLGASSAAYALVLYSPTADTLLERLIPQTTVWNSAGTDGVAVRVSDGAFVENMGIVQLLARGVKNVLAFNNTEYDLDTDPATCQAPSLSELFGTSNNCNASSLARDLVQVFKSDDWGPFLNQLKENKKAGGPTFAFANLEVQPNRVQGVAGKYTVSILVIYLQKSTEYTALLCKEVQDEMKVGGKLQNFPHYKTLFQNTASVLQLSPVQINMLANYTEWCMHHPSVQKAMLELFSGGSYQFSCNSQFCSDFSEFEHMYPKMSSCAKQ